MAGYNYKFIGTGVTTNGKGKGGSRHQLWIKEHMESIHGKYPAEVLANRCDFIRLSYAITTEGDSKW